MLSNLTRDVGEPLKGSEQGRGRVGSFWACAMWDTDLSEATGDQEAGDKEGAMVKAIRVKGRGWNREDEERSNLGYFQEMKLTGLTDSGLGSRDGGGGKKRRHVE